MEITSIKNYHQRFSLSCLINGAKYAFASESNDSIDLFNFEGTIFFMASNDALNTA